MVSKLNGVVYVKFHSKINWDIFDEDHTFANITLILRDILAFPYFKLLVWSDKAPSANTFCTSALIKSPSWRYCLITCSSSADLRRLRIKQKLKNHPKLFAIHLPIHPQANWRKTAIEQRLDERLCRLSTAFVALPLCDQQPHRQFFHHNEF